MGQLHYQGVGERSVIGEVIVRRSGTRDFALSFLSGPGFPLLKLQVSGDDVVAEGMFARGRWRGKVANAPKQLRSWIALREVFAELPAKRTSYKRSGWSTQVRFVGGRPEHIETAFSTGERFAFHFAS